jgi:hypothetical protein
MSSGSPSTEKTLGNLRPYKSGSEWRGNAAGRPKGSRNHLGEAFLEALHDDFVAHGKGAIEACRADKPEQYLKVIASILPKQAEIKIDNYEHMDDGQLRSALNAALRDLATFGVDIGLGEGANSGQTIEGEPARLLQSIQ